jgi:hypothetical protein
MFHHEIFFIVKKDQVYFIKTLLLGMFIFVAKAEVHMIETGLKKTDNMGEEYFSSRSLTRWEYDYENS